MLALSAAAAVGLSLVPASAWQDLLSPHRGRPHWGGAHRRPVGPAPAAEETPLREPAVAVGDRVPDLAVRDLEGREVRLTDFVGRMPLVVELSSFT